MKKTKVVGLITALIMASSIINTSGITTVYTQSPEESNVPVYASRYIIKYKEEPPVNNDFQEDVNEAFELSKKETDNQPDKLKSRELTTVTEEKFQLKSNIILSDIDESGEITDNKYDVIQLNESVNSDCFISELSKRADECIEYIQPDYQMKLLGSVSSKDDVVINNDINTENENKDVNLKDIAGNDVIVALIDSGVDVSHPKLKDNMIDGYDFYHNTEMSIKENSIEDVHGTHLAGVIVDMDPSVKIMPLKVFDNGMAYTSDIIRAIEYAKSNNASIVNCSWGSGDNNPALRETMENSDMLFVCASGNNRANVEEQAVYPGSFDIDNIINVTSVNDDMGISYFSNYGIQSVDIAAKGRDVISTSVNGQYTKMEGTSVSAAYVSGAAAKYLNMKFVSTQELKEKMIVSADKISCLTSYIHEGRHLNVDNLMSDIIGIDKEIILEDDFEKYNTVQSISENLELFNLSRIIDVAGGSFVLKDDGTVWQIIRDRDKHKVFMQQVAGLKNIKQICLNKWSFVCLTEDGYVYDGGMLVGGLSDVIEISEGQGHYLALTRTGDVYGWGENNNGEAGEGTYLDEVSWIFRYAPYVRYPTQLSISNVEKVSAGYECNIFLTRDNEVYMSGLSSNNTYERQYIPSEVEIDGKYGAVTEIQAYAQGKVAYVQNNYMYLYGNIYDFEYSPGGLQGNTLIHFLHGQFYKDENNILYMAANLNRRFDNVTNVKTISGATSDSGLILTNDGEVYGWDDDWRIGIAIPEPLIVWNENICYDTIILNEKYNDNSNNAYKANQEKLENMGWEEGYYYGKGDFTAESGKLNIRKTSPQKVESTELIYDVSKIFEEKTDNWKGNHRVSVRTNNFKGNYSIEIKGDFSPKVGQVYYDILGYTSDGKKANVGRYRIDPGTNGGFGVYNDMINGGNTRTYTLWKDASINRTIRTNLDSSTATFQTFLNGSKIASETTVEGASPKDTFNMTDFSRRKPIEYISGIKFSAQDRESKGTVFASLDSVKLIEHSKIPDIVDDAIDLLDISDITDTPEAVTKDLKPLPSSLANANITWKSSNTDVISNDGKLVGDPVDDEDIIMTAQISNPEDKFTKYMDFKLTVPRQNGFQEVYTGTYSGTQSSLSGEGTKDFVKLPMWKFSYPGIYNGTNGQLQAAQVLVNDGYLKMKKISDRQTANYKECLVGIRDLSESEHNPLLKAADIKITAKVFDTGTMRIAPLTIEGNPICTLILDASTKHIEIVYGKMSGGQIEKVTQRIDTIDPTVDRDYKISVKQDGTFDIYVNDALIKTEDNTNRCLLPEAGKDVILSKLKVWITNVTYANKEVGQIKKIAVNNIKSVTDENLISVWKDICWLRDSIMPDNTDVDINLPARGEKGESQISWSSNESNYISSSGHITKPSWYQGDKEVTLKANVTKNNVTENYNFNITIPSQKSISAYNIYPEADSMIKGKTTGMIGTERFGKAPTAAINSATSSNKFIGSYMIMRFNVEDIIKGDLINSTLNLYQIGGAKDKKYKVAVIENNKLQKSWNEANIMYSDLNSVTKTDLREIGEFTSVGGNLMSPRNISVDISEELQHIKDNNSSKTITLCIYNSELNSNEITLTTKEWSSSTAPGRYRPHIEVNTIEQVEQEANNSKDIPIRIFGNEFEQLFNTAENNTKPEIIGVNVRVIDAEKGIYSLFIDDEGYKCDINAVPFFFWSSKNGTFTTNGDETYRKVIFQVDEDKRKDKVKVIVGIGDGLGYSDRKAIVIDGNKFTGGRNK